MARLISPAQPSFVPPVKCGHQRMPTEMEWEANRLEIKHLYIHKRQKLRHIMRYMEVKHGFKATEQMYKKRFARWGIQKNSRRSPKDSSTVVTKYESPCPAEREYKFRERSSSVSENIQLSPDDLLRFAFLHAVRSWSLGFFEAVHLGDSPPSLIDSTLSKESPQCHSPRETIIALQLISDMLDRGYGTLAGKVARKAFLLIEDMLTLEGPALVWNLLEVFHSMITRQHEQLFRTLLTHVVTLVNCRIPKTHPLSAMLYNLQRFISILNSNNSADYKSSIKVDSSPQSTPATQVDEKQTYQNYVTSHAVSTLLNQAWILNAELLFNNFDLAWFKLYLALHWESCSIPLPLTVIHTVKQWLTQMEEIKEFRGDQHPHRPPYSPTNAPIAKNPKEQQQRNFHADVLPLHNYQTLRSRSVAALFKHLDSVLSLDTPYNENIATKLRIMPALVKARMVERFADDAAKLKSNGSKPASISHDEASSVACVIRALMEIDAEGDDVRLTALPDVVEKMQSLIILREYANGRTDPQVIQEMWLLEAVLIGNGDYEEAQRVRRSAIRRLQDYTEDIPVYAV